MMLSCGVLVLVSMDMTVLLVGTWRLTGNGASAYTRLSVFVRGALNARTIWTKVLMLSYLLIVIPNQATFLTPAGDNTTLSNAEAVLCLLGVVLLLFSYSLSVFTYVEIMIESRVFGSERTATYLRLFKWFFFITSGLCLTGTLASVITFSVFLKQLLDLVFTTLGALIATSNLDMQLAQGIMLVLLCTQAVMMMQALGLLMIVTYKLSRLSKKARGMKDLMKCAAGLWMAWLGGIPNLGLLAVITPVVSYILTGAIPSWWPSHYQTTISYLWLIWAYFMSSLLWLCCMAYAMRTRTRKSWFEVLFAQLIGQEKVMNLATGASGSSTGASKNATVNADNDDNEMVYKDDDDGHRAE